jgi:hypothetical protein
MWELIVRAVITLIPMLVKGVESFKNWGSKAGSDKLNTVTQMALNGLAVAHIIDPTKIGEPETTLVQDVSNAIVKYYNKRGVFTTSA